MTPLENELIAMKEMAEWRIKKNLRRESPQLDSVLFANCARGLRKSDWRELVDHLLTAGVLTAGFSERDALTLSLNQPE
jgi:hypothetical protein